MDWEFERIAGPYGRPLYGLAWDGEGLLFSVPSRSLILRYHPDTGAITEFRRYAYGVKSLAFDREATLYGCQSGSRRIVRFNRNGSTSPMEYRIEGRFHNNPHDLAADSKGRIWFSDPVDDAAVFGPQLQAPLEHQSVLRLEQGSDGVWRITRLTHDTRSPRGVLLSRDERTLYVSDANGATNGEWELRAYPIHDADTLGSYTLLYSFGSDSLGSPRGIEGMCLDRDGNIVACAGWSKSSAGPLIYVFAPSGRMLESRPAPADEPIKCAFGDTDLSSLYITTAGGDLLRARNTGRQGFDRMQSQKHLAAQTEQSD
jgi:gluconolactonase